MTHEDQSWWQRNLVVISAVGLVLALSAGFVALQKSRLESCQRTYESYHKVFRPFFPKDETTWTRRQHNDWTTLLRTEDELSAQCGEQIKPYLF